MKIKTKLTIFGIIMLAIVAIFAYEMKVVISDTHDSFTEIVQQRTIKMQNYQSIVYNINSNIADMLFAIQSKNPSEVKEIIGKINERRLRTKNAFEKLKTLKWTKKGQEQLESITKFDRDEWAPVFGSVIFYLENYDFNEAIQTVNNDVKPLVKEYTDILNNEVERLVERNFEEYQKSEDNLARINTLLWVLFIASIIVVLFFTIWLWSDIKKSISASIEKTTQLSSGVLTQTSNTKIKDETKQILDASETLTKVLKEITAELNTLTNNMLEGKLDYRANSNKFKGEFKNLVEGLNSTVDALVKPMNVTAEYVDRISKGDIPPIITDEYKGDFNEIKNNINLLIESTEKIANDILSLSKGNLNVSLTVRSENDVLIKSMIVIVDSLKALVKDAAMLAEAAREGRLDTRADASKHQGDFRAIVQGINETLDNLVEPITNEIEIMQKLANGDLTEHMDGNFKGEFKKLQEATNHSLEALNDLITEVKKTVDEVSRGAMQVSDASSALSQGATEQAASLEEITSSMSEIASQVKTNADNAHQASILTNEAKEYSERGNRQMENLIKAMNEINTASENISKIIRVIDEIAFQTNLLALNAAVEAARAGRHGKGFAVVAEEVRNLAARSATAAKETAELIDNTRKAVDNGIIIVSRTSEALEEIRNGAIKSADIVGEIATSSNEQAQAIAQINEGLSQIDKVTQTNTASAEESASASEELSGQAGLLKEIVQRFKTKETSSDFDNEFVKENRTLTPAKSKGLPSHTTKGAENAYRSEEDFYDYNMKPSDVIKLDEDDFGKF